MKKYDVFLCYNSEDKQAVARIGEKLKKHGLAPWLDAWELRPDLPWQEILEENIEKIKSAAVFIGKSGVGPWQNREQRAFIDQFVNRGRPVVPVILSKCETEPRRPLFLKSVAWVDFRKKEPDPLERLLGGISGGGKNGGDIADVRKVGVAHLKISNVKCFENIEVTFNPSANENLIIGANGKGKSTILQLLALGLCGVYRVPFPYNWKKVVKTNKEKGFFEIGLRIETRDHEETLSLKYEIDDNDLLTCIEGENKFKRIKGQLLILGYGASRHIKLEDPSPYKDIEAIATLFGENGYLKHIKVSKNYQYINEYFHLIKPLINSVLDRSIHKEKALLQDYDPSSLYFSTPYNPEELIPVEALSEGFKSTFIWLFDMIIRFVERGYDLGNAHEITGIVLLDEIDLHLHPVWQRTFLPALIQVFPNIQFIATTHSPFVVQTAGNDNLIILETDKSGESVKSIDRGASSEMSHGAVIREIFNIQSPYNYETELELNEFRNIRDAILRNEPIDEGEFKNLVRKIAAKGLETESVMRRELMQLKRQTGRDFDL